MSPVPSVTCNNTTFVLWRRGVTGVRPGVSSYVASGVRAFKGCLGFFSLARRPASDAFVSWLVIFWTASVEPVLFDTLQLSLLQESSTTAIRVHRRGSDPFPTLPSEVYPLSVSLSSVYLRSLSLRPTLPQQQPRVPASAGPLWSA